MRAVNFASSLCSQQVRAVLMLLRGLWDCSVLSQWCCCLSSGALGCLLAALCGADMFIAVLFYTLWHVHMGERESILKSLQLQYIKQRGECWCVGFPHQHLLVCLQPFVFQTRKVSGVCAAAPVGHRGHIGRKQMYANQSHFLRLGGKRISGFLSFSNGSGCNWQLQSWEG